jgi:hypothetical protein
MRVHFGQNLGRRNLVQVTKLADHCASTVASPVKEANSCCHDSACGSPFVMVVPPVVRRAAGARSFAISPLPIEALLVGGRHQSILRGADLFCELAQNRPCLLPVGLVFGSIAKQN